jgi:hypothetical protein
MNFSEQIMREIAAIGADFRQLSSFNEETPADPMRGSQNNSGFHTNGVSSHEQILIGQSGLGSQNNSGFHTNGVSSHEQILIGQSGSGSHNNSSFHTKGVSSHEQILIGQSGLGLFGLQCLRLFVRG